MQKQGHRTSLRIRFDKDIDSEVRRSCKEFVSFLRKEYFFPLRVVIYVKNVKKLIAMDGDKVYGTFWSMNDDYSVEPHIRVAAGDYNALKLTPIGQERQATKYARYILDEYAETREHP